MECAVQRSVRGLSAGKRLDLSPSHSVPIRRRVYLALSRESFALDGIEVLMVAAVASNQYDLFVGLRLPAQPGREAFRDDSALIE